MKTQPIVYQWLAVDVTSPEDGVITRRRAMVPLLRYDNLAGRQFSEGEEYTLDVAEFRTRASHSHFFAALHEAFDNLPENLAVRFPSFDHWRKSLLIDEGFYTETEFPAPSKKFAMDLGKYIRGKDSFARILITEKDGALCVIIREAKSQSQSAMGREEFERSKKAVLDRAAAEIDVSRAELTRNAGKSA